MWFDVLPVHHFLCFHLRSVLSSKWQISWQCPWCWASQLRSKSPALPGTKERRRVRCFLSLSVHHIPKIQNSVYANEDAYVFQVWRAWGPFKTRLLPSREMLCGGCTPWFPPSVKWDLKTMCTGMNQLDVGLVLLLLTKTIKHGQ